MIPGLMQFPEGQILGFMLILLRLSAFLVAMPIFGAGAVPPTIKAAMALALTVALSPMLISKAGSTLQISEQVILWAGREVLIGVFMGFLMRFYFFAVSVAGELIGISSGLSSAQIFNPAMGTNSNVIEQFQLMLATLLFLALNGHHIFFEGLVESFNALPIGVYSLNLKALGSTAAMVQEILVIGLRLSAPVLVSVFLAQVGLGIVGRAVPQINVLVTSLQLTIVITFVVMVVAISGSTQSMIGIMNSTAGHFVQAIKGL